MLATRITTLDMVRGMGSLPHVGAHPGTAFCLGMGAIMALACAQTGGLAGLALGLAGWAATILPLFALGARSRARLSDRLERRQLTASLLRSWAITEIGETGGIFRIELKLDVAGHLEASLRGQDTPVIPEGVRHLLERIFTRSLDGRRRHAPRPEDLRPIRVVIEPASKHETMAAHAELARLREALS